MMKSDNKLYINLCIYIIFETEKYAELGNYV